MTKVAHRNDPICSRCNLILEGVHPDLHYWLWIVRSEHPDAHISCGFRGPADQEKAYMEKKSQKHWPDSKHNKMEDGLPCAEAMDFFRLDDAGIAHWENKFFAELNDTFEKNNAPLEWGGSWTWKDRPHFQLKVKRG